MTQQVFMIESGDPNGFILSVGPAMCYTKAGGLWAKYDACYSNTGWVCLIKDAQ